jgi:hypothetical protein
VQKEMNFAPLPWEYESFFGRAFFGKVRENFAPGRAVTGKIILDRLRWVN